MRLPLLPPASLRFIASPLCGGGKRTAFGYSLSMTTLFFDTALLPAGWAENVRLTLEGGRIVRLHTGAAAAPVDERHAVALPGLANVHSHGFQRGMAGLAERRGPEGDNFWTWREVMYRFLDRLTPEEVEAITAFAFLEMLERGFTRVGEFHYLHHDPSGAPYANVGELAERIGAAAEATGIGLTMLPVFYAHGNFGGAEPSPGQRRFLNDVGRFARIVEACGRVATAQEGGNLGVAPHSLRAVTPAELEAVAAMAPGGPIHIHAAEQTKEVEDCRAWSGARPVEWLLDQADIDARWCLVHATHVTPDETQRLAASGAGGGAVPGDRSQSRRRHLPHRRLSRRRRAFRARHRFEHRHRSGAGAAHARIRPAPQPPRPQRAGGGGRHLHGPPAVRCGAHRRQPGAGNRPFRAGGRGTGGFLHPRRGRAGHGRAQSRRHHRFLGLCNHASAGGLCMAKRAEGRPGGRPSAKNRHPGSLSPRSWPHSGSERR